MSLAWRFFVSIAPRRSSGALALYSLDENAARFLMEATGALVGHAHTDSLAHAAVAAAVPGIGDSAILDLVGTSSRTARTIGGSGDPSADDVRGELIRVLLPLPEVDGSTVGAVLRDGRVQMRSELGDGARDEDTYSMISVPVLAGDKVLAALSLLTYRRHDRYGRSELALIEAYASRIGRALMIVQQLEGARREAQAATSHLEILQATMRSLESGLAELRDETQVLRAENASLRAQLASADTGNVPSSGSPGGNERDGSTAETIVETRPTSAAPQPVPPELATAPARVLRSTLRRTPKSVPLTPSPA